MTQGGYQVIIILQIKSKMAAAKKRCFLRFNSGVKLTPFQIGPVLNPVWC